MAATKEVVYTEAQTQTFMDDTNLNPVVKEARGEVQVTLVFDGVDIDPGKIFDAVQTLGTVQTDKVPTRLNYNFIIS
jgi:hypothetical protein